MTASVKGRWNKKCIIPGRLEDKLIIVTGANTGIGLATVGELARRGAKVIMACRNLEKATAAKTTLLKRYGTENPASLSADVADKGVLSSLSPITEEQLVIEELDLASFESIRQFARRTTDKYHELHVLINNAAIIPENYRTTTDGQEMQIGVNHLGPFLLTQLLLPLLRRTNSGRIIFVSSLAHRFGQLQKPNLHISPEEYGPVKAYAQTKLANVMYARELSGRLQGTDTIVVSLHPGSVNTELVRDMLRWYNRLWVAVVRPFSITPWKGAQTTLYTVLAHDLVSGGYYSNCQLTNPDRSVEDEGERKWLWKKSCDLVGLKEDGTE